MDRAINAPGHGKNVFGVLNTTGKNYLNGGMKLIGKLGRNDTSKIGILTSTLKDVFIKFADQCIHILNIK